ncbi:MAG: hypothetical protein HLUCCA01_11880 [Bacteroidetes bacterium HLUCCA01]|nr:MAG: hypothetical protein HLUCCA01_11880 [Bacteroidetes bacterium HLUCCA01]
MIKHTSTIIILFALTFAAGLGSGYFLRGALGAGDSLTTGYHDTRGGAHYESGQGNRQRQGEWQDRDRQGMQQGQRQERDRQADYERFRTRLIAELELAPEQIDPFFEVMTQSRRALRDIREDNQEALRREMREQAEIMHEQVDTILNDEQFERWMEMSRRLRRD